MTVMSYVLWVPHKDLLPLEQGLRNKLHEKYFEINFIKQ